MYAQGDILTPEDNEAKHDIIENLSNAVNHNWGAQYDMLNGSKKFDDSSFVIYNSQDERNRSPNALRNFTLKRKHGR